MSNVNMIPKIGLLQDYICAKYVIIGRWMKLKKKDHSNKLTVFKFLQKKKLEKIVAHRA